MQSISGIITQIRTSKGEVPPSLVGPSITTTGDHVFVFGGRLTATGKVTNQLFIMDVKTQVWTRHIPSPDSDKPPSPRYFHSANIYKRSLIIFGGMGYPRSLKSPQNNNHNHNEDNNTATAGLSVVEDVTILDMDTMTWRRPTIRPSLFTPKARYAHLAEVVGDKLIVIGGQDGTNSYLPEMNILDIKTWEWVQMKSFDKHVGAYRSIAVTTPPGTRLPAAIKDNLGDDMNGHTVDDDHHPHHRQPSTLGQQQQQQQHGQHGQSINEEPIPIYLYSNYNFSDVRRELQLIFMSKSNTPTTEDCSQHMTGSTLPPGLRFPTGHTLGHHLIMAGTQLSSDAQAYCIWALNLGTLTWSRIETGNVFSIGSWNRGTLHEASNRFLVFGNQDRNLVEDYNHRQTNFEHVAVVDLEAFGVYQLPRVTCSTLAQEMGLSLLNEPAVSDFYMITRENQRIPVNSAVLAQRWPYFADLIEINKRSSIIHVKNHHHHHVNSIQDNKSEENHPTTTPTNKNDHSILDSDEYIDNTTLNNNDNSNNNNNNNNNNNSNNNNNNTTNSNTSIKNVKSHSMIFPYSYPVVIALLQFIYTDNLLTAQQYQPHILAQLLLLADMYELPRLRELATHALHQMLNMSTAPLIFETAALSHQTSLQIRALKMMIAAKKMIQQQQIIQARINVESNNNNNSNNNNSNSNNSNSNNSNHSTSPGSTSMAKSSSNHLPTPTSSSPTTTATTSMTGTGTGTIGSTTYHYHPMSPTSPQSSENTFPNRNTPQRELLSSTTASAVRRSPPNSSGGHRSPHHHPHSPTMSPPPTSTSRFDHLSSTPDIQSPSSHSSSYPYSSSPQQQYLSTISPTNSMNQHHHLTNGGVGRLSNNNSSSNNNSPRFSNNLSTNTNSSLSGTTHNASTLTNSSITLNNSSSSMTPPSSKIMMDKSLRQFNVGTTSSSSFDMDLQHHHQQEKSSKGKKEKKKGFFGGKLFQ